MHVICYNKREHVWERQPNGKNISVHRLDHFQRTCIIIMHALVKDIRVSRFAYAMFILGVSCQFIDIFTHHSCSYKIFLSVKIMHTCFQRHHNVSSDFHRVYVRFTFLEYHTYLQKSRALRTHYDFNCKC